MNAKQFSLSFNISCLTDIRTSIIVILMKDNKQAVQKAEQMAAKYLHLGNLASERGDKEQAERHYERSQKYHDKMNEALGNC